MASVSRLQPTPLLPPALAGGNRKPRRLPAGFSRLPILASAMLVDGVLNPVLGALLEAIAALVVIRRIPDRAMFKASPWCAVKSSSLAASRSRKSSASPSEVLTHAAPAE
jgi:hypothetical protein